VRCRSADVRHSLPDRQAATARGDHHGKQADNRIVAGTGPGFVDGQSRKISDRLSGISLRFFDTGHRSMLATI
jgi:hypothetical protein